MGILLPSGVVGVVHTDHPHEQLLMRLGQCGVVVIHHQTLPLTPCHLHPPLSVLCDAHGIIAIPPQSPQAVAHEAGGG